MINAISKIGTESAAKGWKLLTKGTVSAKNYAATIIPENCHHIDIIKAQNNLGTKNAVVLSFKDACGKLLKTIMTRKGEGEALKVIRDYRYDDDVIFSTTKKYKHNVLNQNTNEIFKPYLDSENSKGMLMTKLDIYHLSPKARTEQQVYRDVVAKKGIQKEVKTSAIRFGNGKIINKKIISDDKAIVDELENDPYLFIRNYDEADFAKSAKFQAEKRQSVENMPGNLIDKKIDDSLGCFQDLTQNVIIDTSKLDKIDIVDTLNHEYRHKWQFKEMRRYKKYFLNILKPKSKQTNMTLQEKKIAKRLLSAQVKYCSPKKNYEKYYDNFMEVDARNAGAAAVDEYKKYSELLAKYFSMPLNMVYCRRSLKDYIAGILRGIEIVEIKTIPIKLFEK